MQKELTINDMPNKWLYDAIGFNDGRTLGGLLEQFEYDCHQLVNAIEHRQDTIEMILDRPEIPSYTRQLITTLLHEGNVGGVRKLLSETFKQEDSNV